MLQDAIERIFVGDVYGDIYAGVTVIRGENVVLLGEIVPLVGSEAKYRTWIKRMKSYRKDEYPDRRPKRPSLERLSIESAKSGLKTEFCTGWFS